MQKKRNGFVKNEIASSRITLPKRTSVLMVFIFSAFPGGTVVRKMKWHAFEWGIKSFSFDKSHPERRSIVCL